MCGIAGIVLNNAENRAFDASLDESVRRSIGALAHRGPDAEGIWCGPGVLLAHRRLSIIDLGGGAQPMGNEDGAVQVTFNGEIYNHADLRRELTAKGHCFRTRSDTEVIVHLYEEYGDELVHKLRGMFAFALWDSVNRRCLLARDRVGIKPLYYYHDHQRLLFGSELKAILAYANVPREIDVEALEDYLSLGVVTGERSIFRGIRKLPPGHVLSI
ncbi:MAG: asparagine synthetase B, partial [Gemmataceae bacterium]|nr:asparagine synthetase B [Gemmataceae bacterium]